LKTNGSPGVNPIDGVYFQKRKERNQANVSYDLNSSNLPKRVFKNSQTWANDHLGITTTCLQRPLFCGVPLSMFVT